MKTYHASFWLACFFIVNCKSVYSSDQSIEMRIVAVKGNNIVASKGELQGVLKNTEYQIVRRSNQNENILGTAKVFVTKQDKSGLKIISLRKGKVVMEGDWLVELSEQEESIFSELDGSSSVGRNDPQVDNLQRELIEEKSKRSHTNGMLAGAAICCGIVLLLNIGVAAGSQ